MISINKCEHNWYENMTVESLLQDKKYTFPRIVVKVNGNVVKKSEYSAYQINDGDIIDAIHMIGGG